MPPDREDDYIILPVQQQNTYPHGEYYGVSGAGISHQPDGYNPYWCCTLDSLVLELISENIAIDFDPWDASNMIRPKSAYLRAIQIKATSIADAEYYHLDASGIDPITLRVALIWQKLPGSLYSATPMMIRLH